MGSVIRRFAVVAALLVALVPAGARAGTTTYSAPWSNGPQGGDQFNYMSRNGASGEMLVVRATPGTPGGALGCNGQAGFSNFALDFDAASDVTKVEVSYKDAILNPYTWFSVSLRQGDNYVDSVKVRGPVVGDGTITLEPDAAASGPLTLWFGIETAQSCGNFDGGRAIFPAVTVTTA